MAPQLCRQYIFGILTMILVLYKVECQGTMSSMEISVTINNVSCSQNSDLHIQVNKTSPKKITGIIYYLYNIKTIDNTTYEDISLNPNIAIRNKCPRQCINISARIVIRKNQNEKTTSAWAPYKQFCGDQSQSLPINITSKLSEIRLNTNQKANPTKKVEEQLKSNLKVTPKTARSDRTSFTTNTIAGLQPPWIKDLRISENIISMSLQSSISTFKDDVAMYFYSVKLRNKNNTKKSSFTGDFRFEQLEKDECIFAYFRVSIVTKTNRVIHSSWTSVKPLCVYGSSGLKKYRPLLSTILSVLIPTVSIFVLVVCAFASYYRKKVILQELEGVMTTAENEQLLQSSKSSQETIDSVIVSVDTTSRSAQPERKQSQQQQQQQGPTNDSRPSSRSLSRTTSGGSTPVPSNNNKFMFPYSPSVNGKSPTLTLPMPFPFDDRRPQISGECKAHKPKKMDDKLYTMNKSELSKLFINAGN